MRKQVTLIKQRVIDALKDCSLALVCCLWAAAIAPAQSISGRITGAVTDQAGAVIRNTAVTVTNEGTGAQRRVTVDENGFYVAPELPVGFYTLKVEGGGFAAATRTRVKVDVGAETRVDVTLAPQATEAAVNVRAEAPLLQPDSSALAEVVNNKQVLETSANSNYNALQTTLKQRLARGLNFYVAYTWSKSIDDASNGIYGGTRGVSFPQDSYNLRAERAVSIFDTRHRFSANFTYDLDFLSRGLSHWPKLGFRRDQRNA